MTIFKFKQQLSFLWRIRPTNKIRKRKVNGSKRALYYATNYYSTNIQITQAPDYHSLLLSPLTSCCFCVVVLKVMAPGPLAYPRVGQQRPSSVFCSVLKISLPRGAYPASVMVCAWSAVTTISVSSSDVMSRAFCRQVDSRFRHTETPSVLLITNIHAF